MKEFRFNSKGQKEVSTFYVDVDTKGRLYFISKKDQMTAVNYYSVNNGLDCSYGTEWEIDNINSLSAHQQRVYMGILKNYNGSMTQEPYYNPTLKAMINKNYLSVINKDTNNVTLTVN